MSEERNDDEVWWDYDHKTSFWRPLDDDEGDEPDCETRLDTIIAACAFFLIGFTLGYLYWQAFVR